MSTDGGGDDFDDTDELPSTSQVFKVPDDSPAAPTVPVDPGQRSSTTPLPSRSADVGTARRPTTGDPVDGSDRVAAGRPGVTPSWPPLACCATAW